MPSRCDWLHKNLLEVVNATGMVAFTLARDVRFSLVEKKNHFGIIVYI